MTPIQLLRLVSEPLEQRGLRYAVCGGIAASMYRPTFRLTNDLDLAVASEPACSADELLAVLLRMLEELGMKHALGWIPNIAAPGESSVFLVIGETGENLPHVDFLLPRLPWVEGAVRRAQSNSIDFGFGLTPTVTVEDVIISKVYALSKEPNRFTDADDIQAILGGGNVLDEEYLAKTLGDMQLRWEPQRFKKAEAGSS